MLIFSGNIIIICLFGDLSINFRSILKYNVEKHKCIHKKAK